MSPPSTRAAELVRSIVERWAAFFRAHDDEGAAPDDGLRECLRELAATYEPDVRAVGPAHVMAALFVAQSGPGLPAGADEATAFVWARMSYAEWLDVTALVLADAHAWYELMWFCHRYLRLDFAAMLREHALAPPARIAAIERHRPLQVTLVERPEESSHEYELIEAAGVRPRELWRALREQGAPAGRIEEASGEPGR